MLGWLSRSFALPEGDGGSAGASLCRGAARVLRGAKSDRAAERKPRREPAPDGFLAWRYALLPGYAVYASDAFHSPQKPSSNDPPCKTLTRTVSTIFMAG
jgi:hypothetical protein